MRLSVLRLTIAFAVLLGATQVEAAPKAIPEVPRDYIYDESSALDINTKTQISEWLSLHEKATTDQIAVAVFKSLDGEDLVAYTTSVFKKWSLGQRAKDNGVLLAFYLDDKKVRIETGYGMEALLTDKDSKDVIEESIIPWFRKKDYATGTKAGIYGLLTKLNSPILQTLDRSQVPHTGEQRGSFNPISILFLIFMLFMFFRHPILWILSQGATYDSRGIGRTRNKVRWGGGFGGGGFGGGFGGGGGLFGGGGRSGGGGSSGSW